MLLLFLFLVITQSGVLLAQISKITTLVTRFGCNYPSTVMLQCDFSSPGYFQYCSAWFNLVVV